MEHENNRLTDETLSAQACCLPVPVKKSAKEKRTVWRWLMLGALLLTICLCVRACRARDEPSQTLEWIYEEDQTPVYEPPSSENRRVNLALSKCYHISEETPLFYIGFPEENIFAVVFTFRDSVGRLLYQTDVLAPGVHAAINGTEFLQKGTHTLDCLVSVYDADSGALVSDCTTITLQIDYE